ncbi:MAG TPA: V-type ATPase 116kDa subunit family protein [Nitrososphaeraceae archaeon]|nr:V-type ATPase 116kDa subunit family protein [Nitrososphaeraceae archaeon]
MGLAQLAKVTLILPRNESSTVASKLAQFEWFHPISSNSEFSDPNLDQLHLRSQKLFQNIDEIVRELEIKTDIGIMTALMKGTPKNKKELQISEIDHLITKLEDDSKTLITETSKIIEERDFVNRQLDEYNTLKDTLAVVSNLKLDLSKINKSNLLYQNMFIIKNKDLPEIQRSISNGSLFHLKLNDVNSALFLFGNIDEADKIGKVMRSFDISQITIPSTFSQNPNEAFQHLTLRIKELTIKKKEIDSTILKLNKQNSSKILYLRESSQLAREILETFRKPAGLKNFAIIQGYIPTVMADSFKKLHEKWITIVEHKSRKIFPQGEQKEGAHDDDTLQSKENQEPTLFANGRYFRAFEPITLTQGQPKSNEMDPTTMIAFIFPIFYGLMFGDAGQGALLALLGTAFRIRGTGNLKKWGTLILASGISAVVVGLIVGEAFGFHILEVPGGEFLRSLGFIGILNAAEFSEETVLTILTFSINIGITHLVSAFAFSIYKGIKQGKKYEVLTNRLPTLIMYLAIISLMLAAVGANYKVLEMYTDQNPAPFFSNIAGDWVTVEIVTKISFLILMITMVLQIIAVPLGVKLGKLEVHGNVNEELFMTVIEVMLIRLVELFANTISYTRIGIMLLVHVALMGTANNGVEFFLSTGNFAVGIVVAIMGNLGVMMIEGLLVYIQALRLHLYEWFTKFYDGSGVPFKKLVPEMLYTSILWEKK